LFILNEFATDLVTLEPERLDYALLHDRKYPLRYWVSA
jgi:hypothetical protein